MWKTKPQVDVKMVWCHRNRWWGVARECENHETSRWRWRETLAKEFCEAEGVVELLGRYREGPVFVYVWDVDDDGMIVWSKEGGLPVEYQWWICGTSIGQLLQYTEGTFVGGHVKDETPRWCEGKEHWKRWWGVAGVWEMRNVKAR